MPQYENERCAREIPTLYDESPIVAAFGFADHPKPDLNRSCHPLQTKTTGPDNFALSSINYPTLMKQTFQIVFISCMAGLALPADAAEQPTTDAGTLDQATAQKVFPAKPP